MDERIKQITSDLKQVADDTNAIFGAFSSEQLNWKPAADSWSVGQCFEHIIKTNEMFYPEFEKLASGTRKNSLIENYSPLSGLFGRFLIKSVSEDSKKAKVPSKAIVPPSNISPDIFHRFAIHIEELNRRVESCASAHPASGSTVRHLNRRTPNERRRRSFPDPKPPTLSVRSSSVMSSRGRSLRESICLGHAFRLPEMPPRVFDHRRVCILEGVRGKCQEWRRDNRLLAVRPLRHLPRRLLPHK